MNNNPHNRKIIRQIGCYFPLSFPWMKYRLSNKASSHCLRKPPSPSRKERRAQAGAVAAIVVLFYSPHASPSGKKTRMGEGAWISKDNFPLTVQEIVPESENDHN